MKTKTPDKKTLQLAKYQTIARDAAALRAKYEAAAQAVIEMLNADPPPDWFTDVMFNALHRAADRHNITLWKPHADAEVLDVQAVANLFQITSQYSPRPNSKLAAAIHEILTSDETPAELFNPVADFVCFASSGDTMQTFWTPPVLEHMLEWSKTHRFNAQEGGEND